MHTLSRCKTTCHYILYPPVSFVADVDGEDVGDESPAKNIVTIFC